MIAFFLLLALAERKGSIARQGLTRVLVRACGGKLGLLPKRLQTNADAEEWSIYSDSYTNAPRPSLRRPRLSLGIDSKNQNVNAQQFTLSIHTVAQVVHVKLTL